ncbi:hypothetical protein [Coleofasciculus sp. G2-EDA-02]|uniref:hypothetical protein n=1 Tax=Coleofasciculus sp. G2-EDA-02 TaxID=3069529 RepID=UPI0032F381A3
MIRCIDGDSYSQIYSISLTAAKAALSLGRPDLKDRGYQAPVIYVFDIDSSQYTLGNTKVKMDGLKPKSGVH